MKSQKYDCVATLQTLGITWDDATALRRIAMTLHRWSELECGSDNGCIERDEATGKPFWRSAYHYGGAGRPRQWLADREKGALKRLAKVMARYPTIEAYIQGDPRGAPLYILRPGDVPAGQRAESYYNRGIAVHQ